MNLRNNLSGAVKYQSFIPPKISEYQFDSDKTTLSELSTLFARLDKCLSDLSDEHRTRLMKTEAHDSWLLSEDISRNPFSFSLFQPNENSDNLARAMAYALDALKELPISTRLIRNIHYIACQSPDYDKKYRGEYRTSPVWIGGVDAVLTDALFVPPMAEDMNLAITDLENFLNYSTQNVFIKAAIIHYQFEMIHPFIDANGRIGRLLNILFLVANGVLAYPVLLQSHIIARDYNKYCDTIQYVNESGDISLWIRYWLETMAESAKYTIQAIKNLDFYD